MILKTYTRLFTTNLPSTLATLCVRCMAEQSLTCCALESCIPIEPLRRHTKCVRPNIALLHGCRPATKGQECHV